jgi:hypothetical protein
MSFEDPIAAGTAVLAPFLRLVSGESSSPNEDMRAFAGPAVVHVTEFVTGTDFVTGERIPGWDEIMNSSSWGQAGRKFLDSQVGRIFLGIPERPVQAAANVLELYSDAGLYGEAANHNIVLKAERDWLGIQRYIGQLYGLDPDKLGIEGQDLYE